MSGPRTALAFLTPIGGARTPDGSTFAWFPVVGAAIGATLGALWWATGRAWPASAAAAIVVAADLAITGLLHFDGLIDSADGLLAPMERSRRLEVMREPTVGAFGVTVAGAALVARFAALSVLRPSVLLLTGLWCGSRTVMAVTPSLVPYARIEGGLASAFARRPSAAVVASVLGLGGLLGATMCWRPLGGAVAAVGACLAGLLVIVLAVRRLGGFTGDVLGAAGVVFETVGLLVAAARW